MDDTTATRSYLPGRVFGAYLLVLAEIALVGLYMHARTEPVWEGAAIGLVAAFVTFAAMRFAYNSGRVSAAEEIHGMLSALGDEGIVVLEKIEGS